ncbi:hypothetical protein [uncultured Enorma sp.]|uniref:hypothetical protein n=1 Tax=uncultured Enorma sp. TaxID=1714346 RepID=UPI002803AB02|nr:hypothetical protein [uncultured Enorma sp.]
MLNLLKADLYRITRPRGLRGALWQYLTVSAACFLMVYLVFRMIAGGFDPATGQATSYTIFASPTALLGSALGDLFPLFACFFVVEHTLADFKEGFARTLISSRLGKLSYFAERIVLAGILTAIIFAALSIMTLIVGFACGMRFGSSDTPFELIIWSLGVCLNVWALTSICLVFAYATRIVPLSYITAFLLCTALVPELSALASGLIHGYAPQFIGLADVLTEFACWMPSNLVSKLCAGGAAPLAEGFGSLGAALPDGGFTQVIVAPLPWLAAASALILTICRKRDV